LLVSTRLVITIPFILSGFTTIVFVPIRSPVFRRGNGFRFPCSPGSYISCIPSSSRGCARFNSIIISLAYLAKIFELPTEDVGMMCPSSVMAAASNMAKSIGGSAPERISSAVCERCWSTYLTLPSLTSLFIFFSDW